MKKWVYVTLVIVLTLLVFSVWKTKKRRNPNVGDSIGRLTASAHGEKNNTKKDKAEQEKNVPARKKIYKPISLEVGQGSATIVEIDHGLPEQRNDTKEMRHGVNYGLLGAITLRVVDSQGTPVQGATLFGGFWNNNKNDPPATGTSDANGEIALMRTCAGDFNFSITKDGYYTTRLRYWFFKNGYDCAKDGRWLPWNPTVEIPLKDIRNPIAMYRKYIDLLVPVQGEPVGFDFEKGDWTTPYGTGTHSDIQVTYEHAMNNGIWHIDCAISFTNSLDGAYLIQKDEYSLLKSDYHADRDALYHSSFDYVYERTNDKVSQCKQLQGSEGLVFRMRSQKTSNGIEAQYGKIYGPLEFIEGGLMHVRFTYYLNPTVDDTNLEFDGVHNLLDPKWRGSSAPR